MKKIPLLAFIFVAVIFLQPQAKAAETSYAGFHQGYYPIANGVGLEPFAASYTVRYFADVQNVDTGIFLQNGESISKGTKIRFVPKARSSSYPPVKTSDITWSFTGEVMGTPDGFWGRFVTYCTGDYIGAGGDTLGRTVRVYSPFSVPIVSENITHSGVTLTDLGGGVFRVDSAGTLNVNFDFPATTGTFVLQSKRTGDPRANCDAFGIDVPVGARSINFSFPVTTTNQNPNPPTITGPTTGAPGTYTFTISATDQDGNQIRYGLDNHPTGSTSPEQYRPTSGYVNSGTSQTVDYTFSSNGTYTFRAQTLDNQGGVSGWTEHTIVIGGGGGGATASCSADPLYIYPGMSTTCAAEGYTVNVTNKYRAPGGGFENWENATNAPDGPTNRGECAELKHGAPYELLQVYRSSACSGGGVCGGSGVVGGNCMAGEEITQECAPNERFEIYKNGFDCPPSGRGGYDYNGPIGRCVPDASCSAPATSCSYDTGPLCVPGKCKDALTVRTSFGTADDGDVSQEVWGTFDTRFTNNGVTQNLQVRCDAPASSQSCVATQDFNVNGRNVTLEVNANYMSGSGDMIGTASISGDIAACTQGPAPALSADLKINGSDGPIDVARNTNLTINWDSTSATSCYAYGAGWGSATPVNPAGGSITIPATQSEPYTLYCTDGITSTSDLVQVNLTNTLKICQNSCASGIQRGNFSLAQGGSQNLVACFNSFSGCTDASGDVTGSTTWNETNSPQNSVTLTGTSPRTITGIGGGTERFSATYSGQTQNVDVTVTCVPTVSCTNAPGRDNYCQNESFSVDNGCGVSINCNGTKTCDFNWKEVAP